MNGWLDEDEAQAAGDLGVETVGTADGGVADTSGTGSADDGFGLNDGALDSLGGPGQETGWEQKKPGWELELPELGGEAPGQGSEFKLPGLGKAGPKADSPGLGLGGEAETNPEAGLVAVAEGESGAGGPRGAGADQGDGLMLARPFDIRQRRKALLERYFPFLAETGGQPGENRGSVPWGEGTRKEAGSAGMPEGVVGIRAGEDAPGETGGYRYPSWDWYYRQLGLEPGEFDAEASWDWALLPLPKGGLPRERMFDWPGEHFDRHVARANRLMADPDFDPFAALDAALAEDEESGSDRGTVVTMAQAGEDAGVEGSAGDGAGDGVGMGGDAVGGVFPGAGDSPSGDASPEGGQPEDAGSDRMTGAAGNDTQAGGAGNDTVSGTAGKAEAGQPQETGQGADPAQAKAPEQPQAPAPVVPDKPVAPGEPKATVTAGAAGGEWECAWARGEGKGGGWEE
jgi:hypothetical protein